MQKPFIAIFFVTIFFLNTLSSFAQLKELFTYGLGTVIDLEVDKDDNIYALLEGGNLYRISTDGAHEKIARAKYANSIAIDSEGKIYEYKNRDIKFITPEGKTKKYAKIPKFYEISDMRFDSQDNLYVAVRKDPGYRKYSTRLSAAKFIKINKSDLSAEELNGQMLFTVYKDECYFATPYLKLPASKHRDVLFKGTIQPEIIAEGITKDYSWSHLISDSQGNMYMIADKRYIIQITAAGISNEVDLGFHKIGAIAVDSKGHLIIADNASNVLWKFSRPNVSSTTSEISAAIEEHLNRDAFIDLANNVFRELAAADLMDKVVIEADTTGTGLLNFTRIVRENNGYRIREKIHPYFSLDPTKISTVMEEYKQNRRNYRSSNSDRKVILKFMVGERRVGAVVARWPKSYNNAIAGFKTISDIFKAIKNNTYSNYTPDRYLQAAKAFYKREKFDDALSALNSGILLGKYMPSLNFAELYYYRGLIWSSFVDAPQEGYWGRLRTSLTKYREIDGTIQNFSTAIFLKPLYGDAYVQRINFLMKLGRKTVRQEKDLEILARQAPENKEINFLYSTVLRKQGKAQEALNTINVVIDGNPAPPASAFLNRGVIFGDLKQYDNAILDYNKAIELRPDYLLAYRNRAGAYYQKGDISSSIKDLDFILDRDTGNAELFYARARIKSAENIPGDCSDYESAFDLGMESAYYFLIKRCNFAPRYVSCYNCNGYGEVVSTSPGGGRYYYSCSVCQGSGQTKAFEPGALLELTEIWGR